MLDTPMAALLSRLCTGSFRFTELRSVVGNPRTLTAKLRSLETLGWITRGDGRYRSTARGLEATRHAEALSALADVGPAVDLHRVHHPAFGPVLQRYVRELAAEFPTDLRGVLLYGSVARGNWHQESDLDLMVVLRDPTPSSQHLRERLTDIWMRLLDSQEVADARRAGYHPNVQDYAIGEGELSGFRLIFLEALTEGVVLFERDSCLTGAIGRFADRLRRAGTTRVERPGLGHHWVLGDESILEGGPP